MEIVKGKEKEFQICKFYFERVYYMTLHSYIR